MAYNGSIVGAQGNPALAWRGEETVSSAWIFLLRFLVFQLPYLPSGVRIRAGEEAPEGRVTVPFLPSLRQLMPLSWKQDHPSVWGRGCLIEPTRRPVFDTVMLQF